MNHVRGRHVDTYPISMSIKSKAVRCGQTWFSGPRRRSSSSLCKRQLRLHYCTTLFRTRCGFNSAGHVRINTAMINDRRPSTELSRFLGRIFLRRGNGESAFLAGGLNSTKKPKRLKLGGSKKSGGFVGGEIRACPRPPSRARGTAVCLSGSCLMSWNHEASEPTSMYFRALLWRAGSMPACACSRC